MKFTKKIISVLLAFVLVIGTLSVSAFAWTGDGTQQAKITIVPDKTTVSAGDTVKFDIVMNLDENATWATFGNFLFSFMYNSDVLTPTTLTYGPTVAEFSMARTLGIVTATTTINNVRTKSTTADQAIFDANGYNAMCRVQCAKDANSSLGSQGYWEATDGEVLATITCTVAEGVADGTPVCFDYISGLGALKYFYIQTIDTSNNNKGTNQTSITNYDVTEAVASATTTVGSAITYEDSIVTFWKDQIRMDADDFSEFSIRHLAYITAEDWNNTFGTDEDNDATKVDGDNDITEIGFIFYAGEAFAKDDAAKWLQNGAKDDSFSKVPVNYVSTGMTGHEGDYVYSVVIDGMTDKDAMLSSLAYVIWTDADGATHYSYFDDVVTETFTDLYDRYVAAHS